MRALARELGVQAPTLYYRVKNKAELLELLARQAWAGLDPGVMVFGEVKTVDDFIEAEWAFCRRVRTFYRAHPGMARIMLEQVSPGRHRDDDTRGRTQTAGLDSLARLGMPPDETLRLLEATSRWYLAAVVAEKTVGEPEPRATEIFQNGLTLLMDGVRSRLEHAQAAGRA